MLMPKALQKRFLKAACQDAAAESDEGCSQQLLGLLIHIVCCDAIFLVEGGACRTKQLRVTAHESEGVAGHHMYDFAAV